jgi:hypothetical protein
VRVEQATTVTPASRSEPTGDRASSTVRSIEAAAAPATTGGSEAKRGRGILVLGAVAVAAILAIFVAQRSSGTPSPVPPASTATATTAAAEATVNLSIAAEPPEARLFLDDVALATNPFRGAMLRSTLARRLRATAPGFATEERLVTFDRDLSLEMALKPAAIPDAAAPPTAAAAPRSGPLTPGTSAPHAATPTATTPAPGDTIGGPPRKKPRPIDDTF